MKAKRTVRCALTLVLVLVMALGGTISALAAVNAPEAKSLPGTRQEAYDYYASNYGENYYSVMLEGYYKVPLTLGSASGPQRDFWMYVPGDSQNSQPTVLIMTPNGYGDGEGAVDPYVFLEESGWRELSDERKITIALMTPDKDNDFAWGAYDDEKLYLQDSYDFIEKRPFILTSEYNKYIAAYGEAADLGSKLAMDKVSVTKSIAGTAVVGATGVDQAFVDRMGNTESLEAGVMKSQVPVPMWIVAPEKNADVDRLIDYWKSANTTEDAATSSDLADAYYAPDSDLSKIPYPDAEPVAPVYYETATVDSALNKAFAEKIFDNMFNKVRRYPTFGNWSLRGYTPLTELGASYHEALVSGGVTSSGEEHELLRNWYVYVPDSVDRTQRNPVLFLFNGQSGWNDEIPGRTGWRGLAEEEGIILVTISPGLSDRTADKNGMLVNVMRTSWSTSASVSNGLYIPNDLLFVDYVHEWLLDERNGYASMIDAGRFYASGQSMGGSFTHSVIANRPNLFAAAAPVSWVATPGNNANTDVDIAVINLMGQLDATIRNGFAGTSGSSIFNHFISRYNLTDPEGRTSYADFTFMVDAPVCSEKDGRLNKYIFHTEAGYPMFEAVEVVEMIHATMPSILPEAWGFMKNYSRDPETLVLYHDGEVVDTPVNLELAASAALNMGTTAHNVQAGDFIPVTVSFTGEQPANTVILNFTFDAAKFRYNGYSVDKVEGVTLVDYQSGEGWAKVTLMAPGYDMEDLGYLGLVAKEDAVLGRERQYVNLTAEYVLRDEDGGKTVAEAKSKVSFTTGGSDPDLLGDTNGDGVVDILDLSNMVDWFGYTSGNQTDWDDWYSFFDFNNNGEIDISDIVFVARLI